ncbi:MAG: polysaccharide biosynthesis protein, partial [Crenarchaeota archaeon]|nr:polysaccharide biosynthesis protein [Thermoproteota archaeon]
MRNDGTIKKIGFVAFSNVIKLISSILISFVIPNMLGLTNYGYYKVFILYLTYVGLFHFGFIDGIYLKYGGNDYESLDKKSFRTYFKFLLLIELSVSLIGLLFTVFCIEGQRQLIFIFLFLNLIAVNLTSYYQFISQITSRFKEYSTRIILLSFTNILIVAFLYFMKISDYRIYLALIVSTNYILLLWYLYTYRDITFGKS